AEAVARLDSLAAGRERRPEGLDPLNRSLLLPDRGGRSALPRAMVLHQGEEAVGGLDPAGARHLVQPHRAAVGPGAAETDLYGRVRLGHASSLAGMRLQSVPANSNSRPRAAAGSSPLSRPPR